MTKMADSNNTLLLLRECGTKVDADKVMFGTEFNLNHERDDDSESTLDGAYATGGSSESIASWTAKLAVGDKLAEKVEDAMLDHVPYELWIADSKLVGSSDNANKYWSRYVQGHFTKFEFKGEANSVNEYEVELKVYSRMQRGYATIPEKLDQLLTKNGYKFHDTLKSTPADDGLAIPQPVSEDTEDRVVM